MQLSSIVTGMSMAWSNCNSGWEVETLYHSEDIKKFVPPLKIAHIRVEIVVSPADQEGVISLVMTTALSTHVSEGMRGGRTEEKCVSVIGGKVGRGRPWNQYSL